IKKKRQKRKKKKNVEVGIVYSQNDSLHLKVVDTIRFSRRKIGVIRFIVTIKTTGTNEIICIVFCVISVCTCLYVYLLLLFIINLSLFLWSRLDSWDENTKDGSKAEKVLQQNTYKKNDDEGEIVTIKRKKRDICENVRFLEKKSISPKIKLTLALGWTSGSPLQRIAFEELFARSHYQYGYETLSVGFAAWD
ncbi:hypothetical protein RFI_31563, partial [Reticulomyxa filosa]